MQADNLFFLPQKISSQLTHVKLYPKKNKKIIQLFDPTIQSHMHIVIDNTHFSLASPNEAKEESSFP